MSNSKDRAIKIALVRPCSWPIPVGKYNCQEIGLAKALAEYGISVDVYLAGETKEHVEELLDANASAVTRVNYLPCISLPGRNGWFTQLFQLLDKNAYDLIQTLEDSQITSVLIARYGKKKGIPVILWQGMYEDYSAWHKRVVQFLYDLTWTRSLKRNIVGSVAKTKSAADYLSRKGFQNISVCPVGLDVDMFKHFPSRDWRLNLGVRKTQQILLYVGVIEKRRHVDLLLRVLAELNHLSKDYVLVIAGSGPDEQSCVGMIEQLGVANETRLIGPVAQKDLPSLYKSADLFVLPSEYEIFGMVVMEAMYFGLPPLVSATAGPKEIVDHQVDGVIVEELTVDAWVDGVRFMRQDLQEYQAMKRAAQRKIRERFLWAEAVKPYIRVFGGYIDKNTRGSARVRS